MLWAFVFAFVKWMKIFSWFACAFSICMCFLKLQRDEISRPPYYYYTVSAKYCMPAHMTQWCTVSLSIWLTWLCTNCGITFVSVVKTCTTFTSSWCPDVIIFFIRHLDAYNEMVVRTSYLNGRRRCVFTAQTHWHDWEQTWEVMGLWQGVAK